MQFPFVRRICSVSSFVELKAWDEERGRVWALPNVYLAPTESKYELPASAAINLTVSGRKDWTLVQKS